MVAPAPGLLVFNTTVGKLQVFDGATWKTLAVE
jgi:hypothetical protein